MALTNHILSDSPTNNFCTLNPLSKQSNIVLSEGNLKTFSAGSNHNTVISTMSVSNGKWYFEVEVTSGLYSLIGIVQNSDLSYYLTEGNFVGSASDSYGWYGLIAYKYNNGTASSYGSATSAGNIVGVTLDLDAGTLTFYKDGVSQGTAFTGLSGTFIPAISVFNSSYFAANFGQDPSFGGNKSPTTTYNDANGIGAFYYQPPTDALALCTANLPDFTPTVTGDVPQDYFKAVTYTGNGTGQSITGVGFQPDLVWIKRRSANENHWLTDSVRGVTKGILSNLTDAEATRTDQIQSFDTDGFTLGNDGAGYTNASTQLYVSWCWKAGGAAVTNNDGSITSTVSANTDAGFSIVSYTGNATNGATVGHGLSQAPDMTIIKCRDSAHGWPVWHTGLSGANYSLGLEQTSAEFVDDFVTAVSSTTFTLGVDNWSNKSGENFIAYCWHSVEGYSKFGSYTGNGSADGPFVYCGFRPAFVMIKNISAIGSWIIHDSSRNDYNPSSKHLRADSANTEDLGTQEYIDILSNGWKSRGTGSNVNNNSSTTYIYIAFAEQPFKFSNAR